MIKLHFAQNDADEYVDPVTFKVFTDNTHIVAVQHEGSANVFAYDTIERLNIKAKMWKDLVSDESFSRKDIITLQDPQNLAARNLSAFKYIKDGEDAGTKKEERSINADAMGSSAKIIKAKEAVAKARAERQNLAASKQGLPSASPSTVTKNGTTAPVKFTPSTNSKPTKPYNATYHTTGQAAASLTSTGLTPHTSATLALLSEEDYLLRPRRVKKPSYLRLLTTHGALGLELYPEHAPKTVWNFLRLAQRGYYNGLAFHRNICGFMIQGGDPQGTGRGGTSVWNKPFEDELDGPRKHDARGTLSMANKGKNTNSSQFFVAYRALRPLDRKHTVFGRVVDGMETLDALEGVAVDDKDRPKERCEIVEAKVLIDSFQDFWEGMKKGEGQGEGEKNGKKRGAEGEEHEHGDDVNGEEERTWTGKRVRRRQGKGAGDDGGGGGSGVGKYLKMAQNQNQSLEISGDGGSPDLTVTDVGGIDIEADAEPEQPVRKKARAGGEFGNFDSW